MNKKKDLKDVNLLNYEDAYNELSSIVEFLETNEDSLETTMEMFERGKALSDYCETLLKNAELRIQMINGEPVSHGRKE